MRVSVVIPVYRGEVYVGPLLRAIHRQSLSADEVWLVETDPTVAVERIAHQFQARYLTVAEGDFDHAGTRTWAAQQTRGDVVVFLSQDVMPVDDDVFRKLLSSLETDPTVAAVYGRQVPASQAHPFAAVKRLFNYPDASITKGIDDVTKLGLRTAFLSNAFAAYRRRALADVGWFPSRQLMCEDVTAAARLLVAGHRIRYAADAEVWHTHELGWSREMRRYFDVGASHRQQPWIRRRFGHPNSDGLRYLRLGIRHLLDNDHGLRIPEFVIRCGCGRVAFTLGSHSRNLPRSWCARLSSFPGWWRSSGEKSSVEPDRVETQRAVGDGRPRRHECSISATERRRIVRSLSAFNDGLGWREALRSLDYFRCLEVALAVAGLEPRRGLRLLDMGCGTGPVPLFLRRELGLQVTALDLDREAVSWQRMMAERLGESTDGFRAVRGDSRRLPFGDGTFDLVLNLSSIEHIPDDGDLDAAAEMGRVLAPGGRAVLTVPYGPELVERHGSAHTASFERRYDATALDRRLVAPSGLIEEDRVYFGEPGLRVSRLWFAMPWLVRLPLRRLGPVLAQRFLHPLEVEDHHRAEGVCLTLSRV